jgi:class 3 adenylate cyclase
MPSLSAKERAGLPDSAFAYIDSSGKRRLPINDAPHVRNALARFSQVRFENEGARAASREKLLKAARRHGIVPVGFITGQLQAHHKMATAARLVIELSRIRTSAELQRALRETLGDDSLTLLRRSDAGYLDGDDAPVSLPSDPRCFTPVEGRGHATAILHRRAVLDDPDIAEAVVAAVGLVIERERLDHESEGRRPDPSTLPTGFVTHLLTDIEGSTPLLVELGDRYAGLLSEVRDIIRHAVAGAGGLEVEARADEFQAVFKRPEAALAAAIALQRVIRSHQWTGGVDVRVRVGIHSGEIEVLDGGYVGMSIHTAARVCAAAEGGQIFTTAPTLTALGATVVPSVEFQSLGRRRLPGLPIAEELFRVEADGLA